MKKDTKERNARKKRFKKFGETTRRKNGKKEFEEIKNNDLWKGRRVKWKWRITYLK